MAASDDLALIVPKTEILDDEVTSNSFCRICLLQEPTLIPLMSRIEGVMIPEMLYKLCGRQIEVQDRYPKSVCERCLCLLDSAFCFLNLFAQQDERLRSFYWDGSMVERLIQYQKAEDEVGKRLSALVVRNAKMLVPEKNVATAGTITEPATVVSVGINTEEENVEPAQSTDTAETNPKPSDLMDVMEIETEDGFVAYNIESINSDSEEKLVEMKIDVLNSFEQSEEEEGQERMQLRSRRTQRPRTQRRSKKHKVLKIAEDIEAVREDTYPCDTDDQSHVEVEAKHADYIEDPEDPLGIIDPLRCYICDYMVDRDEELEEHIETHTLMLPYDCKECSTEEGPVRRFKTVSSLHNHFRSHVFPHRCETCGRRFQRRSLLATHLESHTDELFTCNECGRQFSHRKTWHNHVLRHSAVRTEEYKCLVCEKVFGNKPRLVRHMQVHTGERPYGCRYCPKRFSDRHQLQCHTEKHIRDKECECDVCGEKFPDHRKLDDHKIAQHLKGKDLEEFLAKKRRQKAPRRNNKLQDERCPFPDCDYRARTYGAMYVHKRTKHLSLHQCEVCNKSFAFMNQLNVHIKLHTGEKPHECEQCGRKFRRAFSYREHLEMHKSESVYACMICQKRFKRPRYLHAHLQTHNTARKFSCDVCGCNYKTKGELKKHIRHKHEIEIAEEVPEHDTENLNEEVYVVEYV